MLILIISALIALAVFFGIFLIFLRARNNQAEIKNRLDRLASPELSEKDELKNIPLADRTIWPLLKKVAAFFSRFAPGALAKLMDRRIVLAGKQGKWQIKSIEGFWFLCVILGGLYGFWWITENPSNLAKSILVVWLGMIFGGLIPFMVLRHQIRKRKEAITYQLPEVLDLLSVSVTAGLSLDGAMQKITESMDGELVDEFRRMQRDVRMGMTRHRAMRLMAERCDVQDLNLFVTSVIQSERLGASMGDTLRIQADNMRDLRRQRARRKAMQAPVKMVFPLVFFIFPVMFVIVLLPSILSLMQSMGK
ncbi:type II secretion system F family protein [Allisonella histaminiformans]|uniref:type II secretion system F family protein n=1 Tax=Allisonella histaminiformans TaxID=209880 RepID=UPI003F89763B